MTKIKKEFEPMTWATRILAVVVLLFGLPFYFGYGNPLPFAKPEYTAWDNIWLTIFPVVFIGLGCGLKYPKIGGYMLIGSVSIGFLLGILLKKQLSPHMIIPFIIGMQYLMSVYVKRR